MSCVKKFYILGRWLCLTIFSKWHLLITWKSKGCEFVYILECSSISASLHSTREHVHTNQIYKAMLNWAQMCFNILASSRLRSPLSLQASGLITTAMWSPSWVVVCGRWLHPSGDGVKMAHWSSVSLTLLSILWTEGKISVTHIYPLLFMEIRLISLTFSLDSLWWHQRGSGPWITNCLPALPFKAERTSTDNIKLWTRRAEGWGGHCNCLTIFY